MLVIYSVCTSSFFGLAGWDGWLYFPQHFCGVKLGYLENLWPFCSSCVYTANGRKHYFCSFCWLVAGLLFQKSRHTTVCNSNKSKATFNVKATFFFLLLI